MVKGKVRVKLILPRGERMKKVDIEKIKGIEINFSETSEFAEINLYFLKIEPETITFLNNFFTSLREKEELVE